MILDFEDETGDRHFQFCFVGFVLGGSLQQVKGMQVLRTEVGIFEKFESISSLKPCGKKMVNGEPERELRKEGSKQLQISMQEFDLLFNYVAQVPWQTGTPARNAVDTLDWLLLSSKPNGDTRSRNN
jgi:hypothetical protein